MENMSNNTVIRIATDALEKAYQDFNAKSDVQLCHTKWKTFMHKFIDVYFSEIERQNAEHKLGLRMTMGRKELEEARTEANMLFALMEEPES